jgi:hypothetical protein
MIIFCEECGARNELDDADPAALSPFFRCRFCSETLTLTVSGILQSELKLNFRDQSVIVNKIHSSVSLGRKPQNTFVYDDEIVSRTHAVIIYLHDNFLLIDHSRNGTFIQVDGENEILVKQDKYPLKGHGIISPSRINGADPSMIIRYEVLQKSDPKLQITDGLKS